MSPTLESNRGDGFPIEGLAGIYVLGCNHRLITIYSQQVRAANLIETLLENGELKRGGELAVVGAGFGGLTAAASALPHGVRVTLFEARSEPLAIQTGCKHRWVHPRIYDWPAAGSLEPDTRDLPALNWGAGPVDQVVERVRGEWNDVRWHFAAALDERLSTHVRSVDNTTQGPTVSSEASNGGTASEHFDVVILANGFGLEPDGSHGEWGYWAPSDGVRAAKPGERWLVSGFGDGALADLLRILIRDFRHEEIADFIKDIVLDGDLANALLSLDRNAPFERDGDRDLNEAYESTIADHADGQALRTLLAPRLVTDAEVIVQGRPNSFLFGRTSAVVNRFLISQIHGLYRRGDVRGTLRVTNAEWTAPPSRESHDACRIELPGESNVKFEGFVKRHGPRATLADFPVVWQKTHERRTTLRNLPQLLDKTRHRRPGAIPPPPRPFVPLLSDPPSKEKGWCLVLKPGTSTVLETFIERALRISANEGGTGDAAVDATPSLHKVSGLEFDPAPKVVSIPAALENRSRFAEALNALAQADVLVADISGLDPGIMFFLGVRAAARRGVTILAMDPYPTLANWNASVPFNLRDVSVQPFPERKSGGGVKRAWQASDGDHPSVGIQHAILEGLRGYRDSPSYRDLPGFTEVRVASENWDKRKSSEPEPVLFLGSFHQKADEIFGDLSNAVEAAFAHAKLGNRRCQRVIDDRTRGLANERLYEALRYATYCIVDLTDWRPNVLYELGVRVAVSRNGVVPIIQGSALADPHLTDTKKRLLTIFGPEVYAPTPFSFPEERVVRLIERMRTQPGAARPSAAALSQDFVYDWISKSAEASSDPFLSDVHQDLIRSVDRKTGGKILTGAQTKTTDLYADSNANVVKEYDAAARERLLAAWFYLVHRYGFSAWATDIPVEIEDSMRSRIGDLVSLADRLDPYLRGQSELRTLRGEVLRIKQAAERVLKEKK